MRLSVQELVDAHVPAYFLTRGMESVEKQKAVGISERRSFLSVRQQTLSGGDPFCEVRRLHLDAAHRRVQATKGICILDVSPVRPTSLWTRR